MALIYEKKNQIAYLTFNRPETHHAVDPETAVELKGAWEDYRDDRNLRCAIITGTGDKSFCAGLDLGRMIPLETGARQPETDAERAVADDPKIVQKAMLRDFELYKPVIAAVNGLAIAAGMELVQACDIRIAADTAKFGLAEVKWAVFPRGGSTVRLPRQIPFCKAMEILLTGDLMDATEALRIGFVNDVVPRDKVMEEAERIASKIVKNGPLAIEGVKKAVTQNMGLTIDEGLRNEWELSQPVFQSRDAKEGPKAFKEKREPEYRGE